MKKAIPVNERLIFALDYPSADEAKKVVEELGKEVSFYKLGLELFTAGGYLELLDWLYVHGKKTFIDLKFFDVPETVKRAVAKIDGYHAEFATVHGNDAILTAAVAAKKNIKILAVTALTSLDQGDIESLGFKVNIQDLVLSRARRALDIGCDGVISSGLEAPRLRKNLGDSFLIIAPGIRPIVNQDDQKRTVNIKQAFDNGADYIVVGRPIKNHHGFETPREAAKAIQTEITTYFTE